MNRPPNIPTSLECVPLDPSERHEFLVEVFGVFFKWAFEQAMLKSKTLVEDPDASKRLGRIGAVPYTQVANTFSEEQRQVVYEFSRRTLEAFAKELLGLLTAQGISHSLGDNHAIQFRLILDVCEKDDLRVVLEETLNRGGKRAFFDNLNLWLHESGSKDS